VTGRIPHPSSLAAAFALVGTLAVAWGCSSDGHEPSRLPPKSALATAESPASRARPSRQGSLIEADSLANTPIGGPHDTALAFRFRAEWTGPVAGVRCYVIVNTEARKGYSSGTGGSLRVALAPDVGGGRHVPAPRSLAAAILPAPSANPFPLVTFDRPPQVVAGHLYYLVFTNVDPRPDLNYVSINALLSRGEGAPGPTVPDDMAVLLGHARHGRAQRYHWRPRARRDQYLPIIDVVGSRPGEHTGIGYMEVWVTRPKPIGDAAMVRQLISTGDGASTQITGAWLRVRRRGDTRVPLQLRIEQLTGGTLASARVPARRVPGKRPGWVRVGFSRPVSLGPGATVALTAAADAPRSYEAFPVRKGTQFGFGAGTVFDRGYAQFNDGSGWIGWDQWGGRDQHNSDLQFVLDTVTPEVVP
jgi:hypothetical protein